MNDLKERCDRNPGYLKQSSFQIVDELQQQQASHRMCKEVYIRMVLAARVINSTARSSRVELVDVRTGPCDSNCKLVATTKSSREAPIKLPTSSKV